MIASLLFSLISTAIAVPVEQNSTLSKRGPSFNWGISLNSYEEIGNTAGNPAYHVFPDGALTSLPNPDGGWQMIWSECENYRTTGYGPLPEQQTAVNPWIPYPQIYFGGRKGYGAWDNGGKWLMSVHKSPDGNPRHLVAFYHAEDGYWPYQGAGGPAWKSVGLAHSYDNGYSWQDWGQIITVGGRPSDGEAISRHLYGGVGTPGCIWHEGRWRCLFAGTDTRFGVAESWDVNASPGSWKKFDGGGFNACGLGCDFPGLNIAHGNNPNIMWNDVLQKYIVAYMGWDGTVRVAASSDLINFDGDRTLTGSCCGSKAWYPSLISPDRGSHYGGANIVLYYGDKFWGDHRSLIKRSATVWRGD